MYCSIDDMTIFMVQTVIEQLITHIIILHSYSECCYFIHLMTKCLNKADVMSLNECVCVCEFGGVYLTSDQASFLRMDILVLSSQQINQANTLWVVDPFAPFL